MAVRNDVEIYKGESASLNFTMNPVQDITGWTIVMTIRPNANDTAVTLTKTATVTSGAAGTFSVVMTHNDTNVVLGVDTFAYDVQRTDAGAETVLSIGILSVVQEVLY